MKRFSTILAAVLLCLGISIDKTNAQGCVAIRSTGGLCTMDEHPDDSTMTHDHNNGSWLFNSNNRYFRSFRHFIGKQEQRQRIAQGTNVINHAYTQDLTLTRLFNARWSALVDVPVLDNSRSSLYEHGNIDRHSTHSFGVGDIRFATYAWLFNPEKAKKGNIQVGLGIKFATGNYNYQDYFYNVGPNGTKRLGPVDQSIQLGDGGTGITAEVNSYYNFSHTIGVYENFFYLSNPRDINGVSTARGGTASATAVANTSDVMSVPDQYMVRGGFSFETGHFAFLAGARIEGLPARDFIGGNDGFRRPGYIFSGEPGINWRSRNVSVYAFVPIAIIRDRTVSVADEITTRLTGVPTHGDAAFADYVVNIGMTVHIK